MLKIEDGKLIFHYDAEEVWIEAWGENALRVRARNAGCRSMTGLCTKEVWKKPGSL